METNNSRSWINRDVLGLALNRFLSDLGHEAGTAILPLFLAAIGAPPFALGLIEAVSDGLSSFTKLFGGWLGDHVQRLRPWAALGYVATGITTGLYAAAVAWPGILLTRAIGWAGRGLRSPLHDTLLTEVVPPSARGRAFGFDEAADTLGGHPGAAFCAGSCDGAVENPDDPGRLPVGVLDSGDTRYPGCCFHHGSCARKGAES